MSGRQGLALTALLTAAGGVGVGCDEVVEVNNLAPEVEPLGWCTDAGRTYLVLQLVDREEDLVDLALGFEGCADGGRCAVETGGSGDGLLGLESAPVAPGVMHRIEWTNAGGAAAGEVTIEVEATDDAGRRPATRHVFPALATCPG